MNSISFDLTHGTSKYNIPTRKLDPKLPAVFSFVGAKGKGKTFACVAMNKAFEKAGYTTSTYLICPTASSNTVYENLDTLDDDRIYEEASVASVEAVLADVKEEWKKYEDNEKYKKVYLKWKHHPEHIFLEDDMLLEHNDYQPPLSIKPPRSMLIIDDVQGTGLFSQSSQNILSHLTIKHRHIPLSLCYCTQSWTGLPRVLRLNSSCFIMFKTADMKQLLQMYDAFGTLLPKEQFLQFFQLATEPKNGFLFIDTDPKKEEFRFRQGFKKTFQPLRTSSWPSSK